MMFHNSSNGERLSVTYRDIGDEFQSVSSPSRKSKLLVFGIVALAFGALVAIGVVFLPRLFENQSSSSTERTTSNTTTTTTTTTTSSIVSSLSSTLSRASTLTSTTTQCPTGYSSSPTGICVDLMNDITNCGSFGFICSSNYTRCTAGVCAGLVILTNITTLIWDGRLSIDDSIAIVSLPLNVTLYNYSNNTILVSSNGVVCLQRCSSVYLNTDLPASNFLGPTAFVFWDDLMIRTRTTQMVFYNIYGFAPNRTTTIEYRTTKSRDLGSFFHFQIQFFEHSPGLIQFVYLNVSDAGNSSTIGLQASPTGPFVKYSFNQALVPTNNITLTFDTNRNTLIG